MSRKTFLVVMGAGLALWASSCSLSLGLGTDQCTKDDDCKARGFAGAVCRSKVCVASEGTTTASGTTTSSSTGSGGSLPAGWECLGKFQYPDAMGMTVKQNFVFLDALNQNPVPKLKMKLCGPLDGACTSPTMSNIAPAADGTLTEDVPPLPGFYLDIVDDSGGTGGAGGNGPIYRDSLAYIGQPVVIPPTLKTIRVITNQGLLQLATILGKTEDPTHGIAVVLTPNCDDVRSPNVLVETADVDGETQELYFKNSLPNPMATETDAEGAVGFFNLPAGTKAAPRSSTFTTKLLTPDCQADRSKCPVIGSATVFIRPGSLTYVHVGPSPTP